MRLVALLAKRDTGRTQTTGFAFDQGKRTSPQVHGPLDTPLSIEESTHETKPWSPKGRGDLDIYAWLVHLVPLGGMEIWSTRNGKW